MDDAIFPLPQFYWLALELMPRAARGYADVAAIMSFALVLGLLIRLALLPLLARAAARNAWPHDDIVVAGIRRRALLWVLLAGLYASFADMPWRPRSILWGERITSALLALSITVTLMRIVSEIVARTQSSAGGGTTLLKYIINALLLMIGVGAALGFFEVSIFPALTALGVGGLAVALAFQDTLANVFAGVNLTAARQIRIGDFISIDGQNEGFVADIGWRVTTLRSLNDLLIFIPNKKLGEAVMTNYSRPDATMWIEVAFRTDLDSDPDHVEAIVAGTLVAAQAELAGLRREPPVVRLVQIGESALEFKAFVAIHKFTERFALAHDLRKRVIARLRAEGLMIPRPQRVIHVVPRSEGAPNETLISP